MLASTICLLAEENEYLRLPFLLRFRLARDEGYWWIDLLLLASSEGFTDSTAAIGLRSQCSEIVSGTVDTPSQGMFRYGLTIAAIQNTTIGQRFYISVRNSLLKRKTPGPHGRMPDVSCLSCCLADVSSGWTLRTVCNLKI